MKTDGGNGSLKDIFRTVLSDKPEPEDQQHGPRIVIHGNGNVIASGGTVHVVQSAAALEVERQQLLF